MKFFKCHSQKMKDDKIICLQDKFTDIGPDVFDGFLAEYIVFADTTKVIRNYAFSGVGKCHIYLPKAIEEIEPMAFENMSPATVFYCVKDSYAEKTCIEYGYNVSNDIDSIMDIAKEQKRIENEQRKSMEEQQRIAEEQRFQEEQRALEEQKRQEEQRLLEEQKRQEEERRIAEENARLEEEKRKAEQEALEKRLAEERLAEERRQTEERAKKEEDERVREEILEPDTVRVFIFDQKSGETTKVVDYNNLPEDGKRHIVEGEIYIFSDYDSNYKKTVFLDKEEYEKRKQKALQPEEESTKVAICPFCAKEILEDDKFCPYCGQKVYHVKVCNACGNVNLPDDKFCFNCGADIREL